MSPIDCTDIFKRNCNIECKLQFCLILNSRNAFKEALCGMKPRDDVANQFTTQAAGSSYYNSRSTRSAIMSRRARNYSERNAGGAEHRIAEPNSQKKLLKVESIEVSMHIVIIYSTLTP